MRSIGGGPLGGWLQLKRKVDKLVEALDHEPLELDKIKEMAREIKKDLR